MVHNKTRTPHLFDCWETISRRLRTARDIRLFLDFDGTLVPICPAPGDVKLSAATRRVLRRLARHPRVHVALVSGRRNAALRKHARIPHVDLLGLYGWERNGGVTLPAGTQKAIPRLRSILRSLPVRFPGVCLEEKGVSFGIHFRGASPLSTRRAKRWARKFLLRIRPDFKIILGKRAWEIVPREVKGKGPALRDFMKDLRTPFLPLYLGDDVSDESAFKALRRGITVRIGTDSPTNARFRLKNTDEVRAFLERLEKEILRIRQVRFNPSAPGRDSMPGRDG